MTHIHLKATPLSRTLEFFRVLILAEYSRVQFILINFFNSGHKQLNSSRPKIVFSFLRV